MMSGPGGTDTVKQAHCITVYAPVSAAFTATPTSGYRPLTVTFINQSTGDYITSLWDLGDAVTSTLPSLTHTYTSFGLYTVTLTVSGPGGSDMVRKAEFIAVIQYKVYLPVVIK